MKIYIGSDHHGYRVKKDLVNFLSMRGFEIKDEGDSMPNPNDDYPVFAKTAVVALLNDSDKESRAILLCGSGQGMCIAANRFKGIRAALCMNIKMAEVSRNDDDCNVLCLSADHTSLNDIIDITLVFLKTPFAGAARYKRRIKEIDQY